MSERPERGTKEPAEPRLRCHECGKRRPESETTLVAARVGGDNRRAARRGSIRVCRDCTQAHVDFVSAQQAEGLNTPLNDRVYWQQAASFFGVGISGLKLTQMGERRAP